MSNTPHVVFEQHKLRTGNIAGARDDFENMIVDLVCVTNPGAFGVQANPGDWGIDVLVGDLDGDVAVWQAKYFIDGYGPSQRQQVQESFRHLVGEASTRGFSVKYWTLCIPVVLPADELTLWQKWKRRQERSHNLTIELWDANALRQRLISPDAEAVLSHYFAGGPLGRVPRVALKIQDVPDDNLYADALFVTQLRHNGHQQLRPSRRQFFNAELMTRDISDKAVPAEVEALREAQEMVDAIWSERFDEACATCDTQTLPSLLANVMDAIRSQHVHLPSTLPAKAIHVQGLVHHLVEAGDAGWARDWQEVRDAYSGRLPAHFGLESVAEPTADDAVGGATA